MALPNFLIPGAAKCGTTSLFQYLKQHPQIGMLESKDANFFVDFRVRVRTLKEYEALFDNLADKKAIGEAPVRALYDVEATQKIKECLPDVRLIIILRNPAEMAHSLWGHLVRNGERLSFKRALKAEPKRMSDPNFRKRCNNWHADYYYFHRGLYHEQVKHYMDTFGKENIRIHIFDDFKKSPIQTCRECFMFLGVDEEFTPVIEKHNVGKVYRHRGLHKLLSQPPPWMQWIEKTTPGDVVANLRQRLIGFNTRRVPLLDPKLKKELLQRYRPDIEKLENLLGRDLSCWF